MCCEPNERRDGVLRSSVGGGPKANSRFRGRSGGDDKRGGGWRHWFGYGGSLDEERRGKG